MSLDDLHARAQKETGNEIDIPKSWPGVLAWIAVKLGPWAVIAVVCGWATSIVYTHQREDQAKLLEAYRANISAMDRFTSELENMRGSIDEAHRRAIMENPK